MLSQSCAARTDFHHEVPALAIQDGNLGILDLEAVPHLGDQVKMLGRHPLAQGSTVSGAAAAAGRSRRCEKEDVPAEANEGGLRVGS
jgi:hypothetical protein